MLYTSGIFYYLKQVEVSSEISSKLLHIALPQHLTYLTYRLKRKRDNLITVVRLLSFSRTVKRILHTYWFHILVTVPTLTLV